MSNMLKNPTILFLQRKVFFGIFIGIFIMINLFDVFDGYFKLDHFLDFESPF